MTLYYSAESSHGSESSYGFANDTVVTAFRSKHDRDNYVDDAENISCEAIPRHTVTKNAANWSMTQNKLIEPEPFSGDFWGIVDMSDIGYSPKGYVGTVMVCPYYYRENPAMYRLVRPFYK